MVLLIIIPMKNCYFIGNINPTFSDILLTIINHYWPLLTIDDQRNIPYFQTNPNGGSMGWCLDSLQGGRGQLRQDPGIAVGKEHREEEPSVTAFQRLSHGQSGGDLEIWWVNGWWINGNSPGDLQDPTDWSYVSTICLAICCGFPYIGLKNKGLIYIYSRYLQSIRSWNPHGVNDLCLVNDLWFKWFKWGLDWQVRFRGCLRFACDEGLWTIRDFGQKRNSLGFFRWLGKGEVGSKGLSPYTRWGEAEVGPPIGVTTPKKAYANLVLSTIQRLGPGCCWKQVQSTLWLCQNLAIENGYV